MMEIHPIKTEQDYDAALVEVDRLMEAVDSLKSFPERGSHPKELAVLGIKEYRQVLFKPYRVIYRVTGRQVIVYLVVDGRRDMQSLLARRLLGA